jgi:hypothetical protein
MVPSLMYENGDGWNPLPAWADFLISVGAYAAREVFPDRRLVLALSLPTRAFAACFAAAGVVRCVIQSKSINAEDHFQYLSGLPRGTPLLLRDKAKGRWLHAVHDGVGERADGLDGPRLKVRVQDNEIETRQHERGLTYLLSPLECKNRVRVVPEVNDWRLPGRQQIGHKANLDFLKIFCGVDDVLSNRVECAIVGHKALIKPEACSVRFAVRRTGSQYRSGNDTGLAEGCLQDILNTREFLTDKQLPYFTRVYAVIGRERVAPDLPTGCMPPVVIFDGASAFLKRHSHWLESNWLVLLDRTDRRYEDAVMELNQRYTNRMDHRVRLDADIPDGIEGMAFWEER